MYSIGLDDVGSALLITLTMLLVSLTVVGLAMWWLYRVFKNKEDKNSHLASDTHVNECSNKPSKSSDD